MYLRKGDVRSGKAVAEHVIGPAGVPVPDEDDEPIDRDLKRMFSTVGGTQFTPDAKGLVRGGKDDTVRLWDLATLKESASWMAAK